MERNKYLKKCQMASFKMDLQGSWWAVKWDEKDLVRWRGDLFIPMDFRFGFLQGNATNIAILHSQKTNSVVNAALKEVEDTA